MNYTNNITGVCRKIWLPNDEYSRDHRCEEQIWLPNVIYLWLSLNTFWSLVLCIDTHVHTIWEVINIRNEKDIHLPNKGYIGGHRWKRNMVARCIVHMHTTTSLFKKYKSFHLILHGFFHILPCYVQQKAKYEFCHCVYFYYSVISFPKYLIFLYLFSNKTFFKLSKLKPLVMPSPQHVQYD